MNEFEERWQCHSCDRILNPDTLGTYSDGPLDDRGTRVDIDQCKPCQSTDVGDFGPVELCCELGRIHDLRSKIHSHRIPGELRLDQISRDNLEQIQIILETTYDL